jgi:hypothetical protein
MHHQREVELRNQISLKRREQYLATRDIVLKAETRVRDAEARLQTEYNHATRIRLKAHIDMYISNREVIYKIAERNRCVYEYDIDRLNDEINLLHATDPETILEISVESKRKAAYYELTGDHTSIPDDVRRRVYERTPTYTGKYQLGLLEHTQIHMRNLMVCEYERDNIIKIYQRALYLYDIGLKDCILDFYGLLDNLSEIPKIGPITEFADRCKRTYLIPDQIRRFQWRARTLKHLPLCDDVICEIFSFLHRGRLCDRKTIDSLVYQETYGFPNPSLTIR